MEKVIIAYVPVIHRGYLNYFASTGAKKIYVLQATDLPNFPQLTREVRALTFEELTVVLHSLGYEVFPFSEFLKMSDTSKLEVHVPQDDVTKDMTFEGSMVQGSYFLRWDWSKSTATGTMQPDADQVIRKGDSLYDTVSIRMNELIQLAKQSSDWWRQVAALAVAKDGRCILAYNKHYPNEHAPYFDGDPRDSFKPGEFIEISSALHGERGVIAEAARVGVPLQDAELYVTTFPCSDCANWIVVAGIKRVFFTGGYSNLNGQKTLRDHLVKLIYVEM